MSCLVILAYLFNLISKIPNYDGLTALHFAAWYNQYDTLFELIDLGANMLALDESGNIPVSSVY